MKKNILFVINPISGGKDKRDFPAIANTLLDKTKFNLDCVFSESVGHAHTIATEAAKSDTDIIVSVGGDGTMNEVASAVEGSGKLLGIIPYGSGNGLARTLKIPMDKKKAILRLNNLETRTIDSGVLNGGKFFNMAGMGFDARISTRFAEDKTRGLQGYLRTTIQEISKYKSEPYILEIDGKTYEREAFMLSIANSSQYGNNAHISPTASVSDGLLDVCIIRPFAAYLLPVMGYYLFTNTADKCPYLEIIKGKSIRIKREQPGPVHLDGEPQHMGKDIDIAIKPFSLQTLI